ncbi:hypothetical protein, partial [Bradyrhizobium sp.]|uniref:hypothetical protein n=1 Tax=Bradyrhizobium sp. TaxID=376 RepID=UPI0026070CCE
SRDLAKLGQTMPRECEGVTKWFTSFPGAREREPGIHNGALLLGGMDSLMCNCTSKPAPSAQNSFAILSRRRLPERQNELFDK